MAYIDFITSDAKNFLTAGGSQFQVATSAPDHQVTITLYQSSAESNRVDKGSYLTEVGTLQGVFRAECSITSPSILYYREAVPTPTMPRFNYVYIQQFGRYYFVKDLTSVNTTLWRMDLVVDDLYSFAAGIKGLSAFVTRNENTYNNLLHDSLQSFEDKTEQIYIAPNSGAYFEFNVNYEESSGVNYHRWVLTHFGSFTPGSTVPTKIRHYCNTNVKHVMTYQTVNLLTQKLLDSDFWTTMKNNNMWANDPTEAISSLRVYPFDIETWGAGGLASTAENFKIGSWTTPTNVEGYYFDPSFRENYNYFRSFDLSSYGSYYADYEDAILLYLPFAGYVELKPSDVYGATLRVDLVVDYDTGEGTYNIYREGTTDRYITSKKATLGIEVPVSSTQASTRLRNTAISDISSVIVAAGLGAVGLGATAGAALTTEAVQSGLVLAGSQHVSTALGNLTPQFTSVGQSETSALNGVYSPLEAFIKIVRKARVTRDYASLRGYPLNQVKTLSSLTGYTEVGEVHVEGNAFKTATLDELGSIEASLKQGIIL